MASSDAVLCCVVIALAGCGPGAEPPPIPGLSSIARASSGVVSAELLTASPLVAGQNRVFYRVTNGGAAVPHAELAQEPVMSAHHGCPFHDPSHMPNADGLWEGLVIFTEPSSESAQWSLGLNVDLEHARVSERLDFGVLTVGDSPWVKRVTVDGRELLVTVAFAAPPKVGSNEVVLTAHAAGDSMHYAVVDDVAFSLTTEMWSMGHSAAGNVNPERNEDGSYRGTAVFSMAGDWVLQLEVSAHGEALGKFEFPVAF